MATQIVIGNGDHFLIDNTFHIDWSDKGKIGMIIGYLIVFILSCGIIFKVKMKFKTRMHRQV